MCTNLGELYRIRFLGYVCRRFRDDDATRTTLRQERRAKYRKSSSPVATVNDILNYKIFLLDTRAQCARLHKNNLA